MAGRSRRSFLRFSEGYLTLGQLRSAPVRLHWSVPLGAVVFGGFRWAPGFWLGFVLLLLAHELGHALMVRRQRAEVVSVDVHALGGACHWSGSPSAIGRAWIAWGGVLAQLVVLVVAFTLTRFVPPSTPFSAELAEAFLRANLILMALNLLPVPPLDGAEAWRLPKLLLERRRVRKQAAAERKAIKRSPSRAHLREVPGVIDDDEPLSEEARQVIERAKEIAQRSRTFRE